MADPRTFTLIGEFKDGITPELEKINKQLAALKANFSGIGSRKNTGFRGAANDIGKLVSAHKNLTSSIKEVDGALRSTLGTLQQYRKEMGKAAAATRAFQKSGGSLGSRQFAQNMDAANRSAQAYLRTLQQINAQSRRMPRGGMGGGFQPPRPPRGGGGYGGMYGGGAGGMTPSSRRGGGAGQGPSGFHMAEFGFAYTLGNAISQPIQNAIVAGFQIGVGLMTKPFEYFANRLGERMQDELSDLKAAGGFFSMAKRQESPFVKNFADAIQFTQENNKVMARLAASLPGKTQDYIEVAKRVSDSVARTVLNDRAATMKMAEQIRAGDIRTYGAKSITEMTGSEATKKTIQVLLGDLTKDTVLAGMGGRAGAGGAMGAYGLPQLSERMISQDEVSMGQMQRYSAIFSDPMIMDALQRNIDKINATSKNSADRLKAIASMYKEIVTPELVERYRRTLAGVAETFNTAIFGEETGLFGLGRKMQTEINGKMVGLGIKFNEFGQMLDETGKVTTDVTKAAREDLAIYDLFRDILVNVGQVLAPIVENLSMIYDPLKQLGLDLNKAREVTYKILQSFNYYKKGFEEFGKQFKGMDKEKFDATRDLRAALATIGNVMRYFKVIGEGDFANLIKQLEDPKAEMGPILQKMIDQFLTSDVAGKIGEFLGTIVGTVLTEVAKVTGFISGRLKQSNKLLEGMKKGFNDAGGPAAFRAIFRDVFMSIGKLLLEIIKIIPIEAILLGVAMIGIPAAVQGLGMLLATRISNGIQGVFAGLNMKLTQVFARVRETIFRVKPVQVKDLGSVITDPSRMLPAAKETALATTTKAGPLAKGMGVVGKFFMNFGNYIKGVGPRFMGFFKGFLGKLTILGGVITSVVSLFQGKDLATALAEGAGPVLGAALGAALIPFLGPIGPMIGSAIGGWIGSLKSVTQPLADGIRAVFGTFQTTFDFLVQIGRDLLGLINGLVRIIPGVGQGFDFLRAVIFALLSPFKLLEIAINGLYDLYLWIKSKTVGVSTEERARMNERRTVRATDEFTIMGREGAGYSLAQQKAAEYAKFQEAKAKGDTKAMNRIAEYMKSIDRMIAQRGGKAGAPAKPAAATPTTVTTGTVPGQTPAISPSLPQQLTAAWQGVETWFNNLPYNLGVAVGRLKVGMENAFVNFFNWLSGLSTRFGEWVNSTVIALRAKWNNFMNQAAADFKSGAIWGKLGNAILTGFKNMITGIIPKIIAMANPAMWGPMISQWAQGAAGKFMQGLRAGEVQARSAAPAPKPAGGTAVSPIFSRAKGGLGDAIASEMRMKPPGSDLVIANTSETVIPAAGGYGMQEFMNILSTGFSIVNQQYKSLASGVNLLTQETNAKFQQAETTNADRYQKTSTSINNYHQQNQAEFGKINQNILQLSQKVATMSSMGGMMGAGGMALGGGYGSAGMQIAGQLGNFIKQTGGAPGSIHEHPMHGGVKGKHAPGSYHYSGRAIDIGAYANEQAGVIARIQQFNAKMGVKPVEFLHAGNDPRGHSDHVHVAYALGQGNPAFFNSQRAAENWEASMAGRMNVRSVTGNTLEGFGGSNVGDIYVTVNAGATNDPDQLAYMVAERIQTAVSDAVNSNILV